MPVYRGFIVDNLNTLFSFDDKVINKEEKIRFLDFKTEHDTIVNARVEMRITFHNLKNLLIPEQPEVKKTIFLEFKCQYRSILCVLLSLKDR